MRGRWILSNCNILLVLCLLCATGTLSAAEWYKDYEEGLELIRKGRYADAIPRLKSAAQQKNKEGLNIKFYGMKFGDYLPHYHLGKAYFFLKDYKSALAELDVSASHGEIQRNPSLYQNLTELKSLANAQMKVAAPQPPPVVIVEKKPDPVPQPPPPEEKKPQPEIPVTQSPTVPPAENKQSKVVPQPETTQPLPSTEELNLQRIKTMVREGARRYFQGEYDSAISSFSTVLQLQPEEFSAQFLLGCSYATKYLLSGSSDQKSLERASAAFQKIRRMNPNHPLIQSPLISPAVRAIYEKSV